jgi:hypothetical protein
MAGGAQPALSRAEVRFSRRGPLTGPPELTQDFFLKKQDSK